MSEETTTFSGGGDIERGLKLLWGMREPATRGPKPGLTLERIVTAAVEAADSDGLGAVSMRRVATDLGVGTMSLYRYVPGKSELLELMLDHVQGLHLNDFDPREHHWRDVMEAVGRGMWELNLRHPWLLRVNQARPLLGPNQLAGVEYAMTGLEGLGLSDQERLGVIASVENLVTGSARTYIGETQAAKRTGISDEEFWAAQAPFLDEAIRRGRYPTLGSLDENTFNIGGEQLFEFGLQRLLDGIADFIASRANAKR